ncbi:MAG: acyl-CoA dehydrogenase family protein [Deltaproteobacteria bacterium]|nr:acyl-CoA dehydrogenase family protein [Deltaproteobacteria bacterium]
MDFGFSQEQEQLRQTVKSYLSSELPLTFARAMMDDERGFTDEKWRDLAGLGWLGLTIPERFGGSGLGLLDLAIVIEATGAVVMPGPFLSTVGLGVPALCATATQQQAAAWLPRIADGTSRVTAAIAERAARWSADGIEATAGRDGALYVLDGRKLFVPDARCADVLVVPVRLGGELGFFCVERGSAGLTIEPMNTVDRTRKLDVVTLRGVRVESGALLGGRAQGAAVLDGVIDAAKVVIAAEMAGAADAALAMTVEYTAMRRQFGRAIATFQSIQHRCADMKVDVENARSLVYYAAWSADSGAPDRRLAAAMAKAYASQACPRVVADAVQLHGGIGFTWEHDLHMFFKRVKADEQCYGDAVANRELVASFLELVP